MQLSMDIKQFSAFRDLKNYQVRIYVADFISSRTIMFVFIVVFFRTYGQMQIVFAVFIGCDW